MEEIRRIGTERMEMMWVKLGNEGQREILERKRRLIGRKKLITENLTLRERGKRVQDERNARRKEGKEERVWIKNGWIKQ